MINNQPKHFRSLLLAFFICGISFSINGQTSKDTIHLNNHDTSIGYAQLDANLDGKRIFIAGENHTYLESNSKLWVQNIKYLYHNAGVRNVLLESGKSTAWLANEYLQTGDSALLQVIEQYVFEEYAERYRRLRDFNTELDSGEKITVIGIDLERGGYGALKVLSLLLPDSIDAPDSIDLHIESIYGMAKYQDREIFIDEEQQSYGYTYSASNTIRLIIENFENHENLYQSYLGERFELFKDILNGLDETLHWRELNDSKAVQAYVFREKYMYNRFADVFANQKGNYYGQFGRCHASKKKADKNGCNWYVFKSLANRLKQSKTLGVEDQILTFGILYNEEDDYEDDDWEIVSDEIVTLFDSLDENKVRLYDLKKDSTLYNFFNEDFDYFFLNTYKADEEHPYYEEDYDFDYENNSRYVFSFAISQHDIDLDELAQIHDAGNASLYSGPMTLYGGLMRVVEENGFASTTYIAGFQSITSFNTNGTQSSNSVLNGFTVQTYFQYDGLHSVRFLDVLIGASLGYSQFNLKVTETAATTGSQLPISSGFLGNKKTSVYTNPSFNARLSLGLDINIGNVTIGAEVGSAYDFSNTSWRLEGEKVADGPSTSLGGLYGLLHAGFNFND